MNAGQIIGFMGDTGNATGIPHLHFEIRDPAGDPMNPFPSLVAAQARERCSIAIGPWTAEDAGQLVEPTEVRWDVTGPDGARWEISSTGAVRAVGTGALVTPGDCTVVPGAADDNETGS